MSETLDALGLNPTSQASPEDLSWFANPEYRVELFDGDIEPAMTLTSFGEWTIEGDFICVWTREGTKEGYRFKNNITTIRTVEVAQGKHVNEEDENGDAQAD